MTENPLLQLESFGQSIWMDFLRRDTVTSGDLKRLVEGDGISGITSNPSIFEKAIGGSHDYDDQIRNLARQGKSADDIYQAITIQDIQMAADVLRPVYDASHGDDGYVSLEVSPLIANDTSTTISEAKRLFKLVDRPNLMIKIPATQAGIPAIEEAIDAIHKEHSEEIKVAKDVSAAAMLIFSLGAFLIAVYIFVPKILILFK